MNTSNSFILLSKSRGFPCKSYYRRSLPANLSRYIFNQRVSGHVDNVEATLHLARCCICYLCQSHHEPSLEDDEINENILCGDYRLHSYAVTTWNQLVQQYISLNGSKPVSPELIQALEYLEVERSSNEFESNAELIDRAHHPSLDIFKKQSPGVYSMLHHVAEFWQKCSSSQYHLRDGETP